MTMARGKQTCKILKEIRRQIAVANDIEFATSECRYKGDCLGTCPKCEAEVRYLEQQLRARSLAGKAVTLAGISAGALAMLMPAGADAQARQEAQGVLKGSVAVAAYTIRVKGTVLGEETTSDGNVVKEPLVGATITNRHDAVGAVTDVDGRFDIPACIGDTLEVRYIGYKTQTIAVTEGMGDAAVVLALAPSLQGEVLDGMVQIVKRGVMDYLDLNVIDEHGNPIDNDDIYVERIWMDGESEKDCLRIDVEYIDEKHPCRIYWDYGYDMKGADGKPVKEATFRIEAEGYGAPVTIKVRYQKRKARKTVRFKHKDERTDG